MATNAPNEPEKAENNDDLSLFTGHELLGISAEDETEQERISSDELHMARWPLSLLTFQSNPGFTIEQEREVRHPLTRKLVRAKWRVEGSPTLGLPTAGDEAVMLVLLELSKEAGWAQDVYFTRYDIIQRLGWSRSKRSYEALQKAFERWAGVRILSENVFYDKLTRSFMNTGSGVIEYEIVAIPAGHKPRKNDDTGELALSHFRWSDMFWRSFKDGNLKRFSMSQYFALRLPISRRLYRLLDAVRYDNKRVWEIGLQKLAEEYLGLGRAKYVSEWKRALKAAHEELVANEFLESYKYEKMKSSDGEKVIYTFHERFFKSKALAPNLDLHVESFMEVLPKIPHTSEALNAYREQFWFLQESEWVELKRRVINLQKEESA